MSKNLIKSIVAGATESVVATRESYDDSDDDWSDNDWTPNNNETILLVTKTKLVDRIYIISDSLRYSNGSKLRLEVDISSLAPESLDGNLILDCILYHTDTKGVSQSISGVQFRVVEIATETIYSTLQDLGKMLIDKFNESEALDTREIISNIEYVGHEYLDKFSIQHE